MQTPFEAEEAESQPKSSISLSPIRSIAPKQQVKVVNLTAIDNAIKTVLTEVQTSLPTAQIKVSSPFATQTRNVTITTSAMKSPIPAVPPVEALSTSPTKTHPVSTLKGSLVAPSMLASLGAKPSQIAVAGASQLSQTLQSPTAGSAAAAGKLPAMIQQGVLGSGKNVVLKMLPGGIQAIVSPPAGSAGGEQVQEGKTLQQTLLPAGQQQSKTGQKPQQQVQGLMLQMGKSGTLQLVAVTSGSQTGSVVSGPQTVGLSSTAQNVTVSINTGKPPLTPQKKTEPQQETTVSQVLTAQAKSAQSETSAAKMQKSSESSHVPKPANVSKISSQPYTKPQTIQQLIESKAKGITSGGGQQMKVIHPENENSKPGAVKTGKPTVVMPGSASASGLTKVEPSTTKASDGAVRVIQPSAVIPSAQKSAAGQVAPGQVALTTAAHVTTTPISNVSTAGNAGPTMASIMANIGGRSLLF